MAQILGDEYVIAADFDPKVLFRDARGIWFSEHEPVEVVLRFHPSVAMKSKKAVGTTASISNRRLTATSSGVPVSPSRRRCCRG